MNTILNILVLLCLFIVFIILYFEIYEYFELKRSYAKFLASQRIKKIILKDKKLLEVHEEKNRNKDKYNLKENKTLKNHSETRKENNKSKQNEIYTSDKSIMDDSHNPKEIKLTYYTNQHTDWYKRNKLNADIGKIGEHLVFEFEKNKLLDLGKYELVSKIKHVSKINDSLGYDIASYDENDNQIFIEVKSTTGKMLSDIFITQNELNTMKQLGENYCLYRVYNIDKDEGTGQIKVFTGYTKINEALNFEPIKVRARIKTK